MAKVTKAMKEAEERIRLLAAEQKFKAELPALLADIYFQAKSLMLSTTLDLSADGTPIVYIEQRDEENCICFQEVLDMNTQQYDIEYVQKYLDNLHVTRNEKLKRTNRAMEIFNSLSADDRLAVYENANRIPQYRDFKNV
jgi:hypothetical protein